jgi:hypothetical protein
MHSGMTIQSKSPESIRQISCLFSAESWGNQAGAKLVERNIVNYSEAEL